MTTTETNAQALTRTEDVQDAAERLAEQVFANAITTMETFGIYLGVELGLYQALADGPADARELAQRAGIHPRYAREWLEQQAVAGVLNVETDGDDVEVDAYARRFSLPNGHRETLLDADSPYYMGAFPGFISSICSVVPDVVTAFRTGGGVPYDAYGRLTRHGIAGLNRPVYRTQIAGWIATMPDIERRLSAGPARVLDLGCGTGSSSIAIAALFPQAQVRGVDLDEASVADATSNAQQAGLDGRVRFEHGDAVSVGDADAADGYQLVCIFEALHDMADPVSTLRAARALLEPDGAVLIGDEGVADRFFAPGDMLERLNYGFSVLHCLPATRAEGSAVEAGTVLRPGTVREYAGKAGYDCTVLPIENDLWRFYRLDPA